MVLSSQHTVCNIFIASHVQRVVPVHSSDVLLLAEPLLLAAVAFPHRVHRRGEVPVIVVCGRVERI